ncbi:AI-2E family transporter [Weeksellaceae bacterium TAE3-ERU29]|nr:AI-2E family transporter [Weeksellaceae bacterium TAE3-ERU29]
MPNYTTLKFSPQNYFYIITGVILSIAGLYYGSGFFIPISFALLISFILLPIVRFLEYKGLNSIFAILITFLLILIILGGISYFFSSQIATIISDFKSFKAQFNTLLDSLIEMYNENLSFLPPVNSEILANNIQHFVETSGRDILGVTLMQTTSFLASFVLVPVYVFLLLLYRKGIVKGILLFFRKEQRADVKEILIKVQAVGKDYIIGLITVMFIMTILNSACLLIIGVDYAIMFGGLAALLIVIPYIGTYVGASLPVLYALVTLGPGAAFAVIICFVCIHLLESNYLTPKIVGSNTSVNALSAFTALILGGFIWGISGMVLAIPFTAMVKKVFIRVSGLQPLALLLGEELFDEKMPPPEELEVEYIEPKLKPEPFYKRIINGFSNGRRTISKFLQGK